ncbi:hypothetical protein C0Q70_07855 [Pomacea canaliculata]|uniref:Cas1p 10 TM acyl transferase domain-containing protein n=1 Tax=Pomacea canaliculata TaxID=400727 RepID=A0A2T7PG89_POMCA|nr:hypothetical protein C0Q70_07855 [Pomacea canaliculata]
MSNASGESYDDHTRPHRHITPGQLTFFLGWAFSLFCWLLSLAARRRAVQADEGEDQEGRTIIDIADSNCNHNADDELKDKRPNEEISDDGAVKTVQKMASSAGVPAIPSVDQILKSCVVFGAIMFYFFLCDYIKIFPIQERQYSRDVLLFLLFLLFLTASVFTLSSSSDKILNRYYHYISGGGLSHSQRSDRRVERLDAGDVCVVPLLRCQGVVQLDQGLHCLLCLDDGLWKLLILLGQRRLFFVAHSEDVVSYEFPGHFRGHSDIK